MIDFKDTISLVKVMEKIEPSSRFLLDVFFPDKDPIYPGSKLLVEYRDSKRRLAPYIIKGGSGVNVKRDGSMLQIYEPPMVGPRRQLNIEDVTQRGFGETLYSTQGASERAAQIQARDLRELQDMIQNRKNKMAAEILTKGRCEINGYADDGQTIKADEIIFTGFAGQKSPSVSWDNSNAKIYADIKTECEKIQDETGQVADIMVVGKNVESYLLNNKEMKDWLMIPNRDNFALMNIKPQYISPHIRRIGYMSSLNLEIYAYYESYTDEKGNVARYIEDDDVIIGVQGLGHQMHGTVTVLNQEETGYESYASEYLPYYAGDKKDQSMSLTMYSRFVLAPYWSGSWASLKVKG